jgi:hypothetical protein
MSGTLVYQDAVGGDNLILSLAGGDYVHSLAPLEWQKLRVGIRATISAESDISGSPAPALAVGLCSGTTYPFISGGCAHFVGAKTNVSVFDYIPFGTGTPTWIRAGTGNNSFQACKKIGTTVTAVSSSSVGPGFAEEHAQPKSVILVDITKGSPNWTVDFFIFNSVAPDISWPDISESTFNSLMVADTPSLLYHSLYTGYQVAVNESANGVINAVNVSWNRNANLVKLEDLAVAKFLLD